MSDPTDNLGIKVGEMFLLTEDLKVYLSGPPTPGGGGGFSCVLPKGTKCKCASKPAIGSTAFHAEIVETDIDEVYIAGLDRDQRDKHPDIISLKTEPMGFAVDYLSVGSKVKRLG